MTDVQQAPPLWQQLQHTAAMVQSVAAGKSLTSQLDTVPPLLRPGVQALSFHVMRQLGRARALRALLAPRKPPAAVDALLCSALALAWDEARAPYPGHTLVSQTVEAARRQRQTHAQAGFVNACLRRFLRERETLLEQTQDDPQSRWNHPVWWIERLQQDYPQHWEPLLEQTQQPAPMTLRVNLQRGSVAQYQQRLRAAGMAPGLAVGGSGVQLEQAVPVHQLPGFDAGDVSVQDAAAQLAAPLLLRGLPADRRLHVLDACAAPGGKTGHLLEVRPDADVLALEIDSARCERIHQNLRRLSVQAEVRQADAGRPDVWWDGREFDAILLDAPCTASGIVRRHPDVRWLRRPGDSEQLARTQANLLDQLWPLLARGGRLLYCTCSLFHVEGERVIQAFLERNTQARLLPSPGHLIAGLPPAGGSVGDNALGEHDSFYYALLEKNASIT
ncbi:MAG: 16S rRNA (cytosine(967)-C(5))-methyltransferase RsmB [Limnohabitans sp.]